MPVNLRRYKICIVIYNIFLALFGLTVICLDFFLLYHVLKYKLFIENDAIIAISLIICNGFLCIICSRIGWKVNCKANTCHIILFGILLLILVITNISIFFWFLCILHRLKYDITNHIELIFDSAVKDKNVEVLKVWNGIQSELLCCGIGGPADYRSTENISFSCCKRSIESGDCTSLYQKGCLLSVYDEVFDYLLYFAFTSLALALIQILGCFCYFYMAKIIKKSASSDNQFSNSSQPESARGLLANISRPQKF